jgi:hypothetical protein
MITYHGLQHTLAGAQEFYRDLNERMRKYDRPE